MDAAEDPFQLNDFILADSFINFDYVPDIPASDNGSDPAAVGSGSDHAGNFSVEEGIQKIVLAENEGNGSGETRAVIMANDDDESESAESESDTSASSSSSSSRDSDDEELEEGEIVDSDGSEDLISLDGVVEDGDGDDRTPGGPIRSKNELETLPLVPPVSVTLGPHHLMLPVGIVTSILDDKVIVKGLEKHEPLNEGSVLWMTGRQKPLGLIDEVFGPVENPYYTVRYNSKNEVPEGLYRGTLISFVPEFANHVLNNKELHNKGYDASGVDDEEVSDDAEFSDDEKESEYMRMQMQKFKERGINNQNPENRGRNRKKVLPKDVSVSTLPAHRHCSPISGIGQCLVGATNVNPPFPAASPGPNLTTSGVWTNVPHAPAMSLHASGHGSPISGIGQGPFGATSGNPPYPAANAGPNLTTSGVWTNGPTLLPQQSVVPPNGFPTNGASWHPGNTQIPHQLSAVPPNGFPTNDASWYPGNTQIPHQLSAVPPNGFPTNAASLYPGNTQIPHHFPVPEIPFQQQINPSHVFPPAPVYPGAQPNIFAPPMYAQGHAFQNQLTYGLNSPISQFQPPTNLDSGSISGNQLAPYQSNLGASAGRGRRTFHHGGCKEWQPWRPAM